jgi:hypothetical protein
VTDQRDRDDEQSVVGVVFIFCVAPSADVTDFTETSMQNNVSLASPDLAQPSYLSRVISNDSVKKGLAGAAAGLLVAIVSEAIWPTK